MLTMSISLNVSCLESVIVKGSLLPNSALIGSNDFFKIASNAYGVVTDPIVSLAWQLCFVSVCENVKYLESRLCQLRFGL